MKEVKKDFELLKDSCEWPTWYMFKFVLPVQQVEKIQLYLTDEEVLSTVRNIQVRESRQGRFVSYSFESFSQSHHDIKKVYEKFRQIEGMIAL